MTWEFHHDPDGVADWRFDRSEYPIRFYVENQAGAKVGYFGYAKQIHHLQYAQEDFDFKFEIVALNPMNGPVGAVYDRRHDRYLGPRCKVWIDNSVIARMSDAMTRNVVSNITDVLLAGMLLSNAPHFELMGLPIEQVIFASCDLERLNSQNDNAT